MAGTLSAGLLPLHVLSVLYRFAFDLGARWKARSELSSANSQTL